MRASPPGHGQAPCAGRCHLVQVCAGPGGAEGGGLPLQLLAVFLSFPLRALALFR